MDYTESYSQEETRFIRFHQVENNPTSGPVM